MNPKMTNDELASMTERAQRALGKPLGKAGWNLCKAQDVMANYWEECEKLGLDVDEDRFERMDQQFSDLIHLALRDSDGDDWTLPKARYPDPLGAVLGKAAVDRVTLEVANRFCGRTGRQMEDAQRNELRALVAAGIDGAYRVYLQKHHIKELSEAGMRELRGDDEEEDEVETT